MYAIFVLLFPLRWELPTCPNRQSAVVSLCCPEANARLMWLFSCKRTRERPLHAGSRRCCMLTERAASVPHQQGSCPARTHFWAFSFTRRSNSLIVSTSEKVSCWTGLHRHEGETNPRSFVSMRNSASYFPACLIPKLRRNDKYAGDYSISQFGSG